MVPVIHVDMSSGNCLRTFLCIAFRRGFLLWWQPCTPIWCRVQCMVWALTGWPPALQSLQQCWQHSYTNLSKKAFGCDAHHVRSARALSFFRRPTWGLFWVDPTYLSHCAAAQFQGVGNLLVALAIVMLHNNTSFKILREFFAMWCHVGTFRDQYERVWDLRYKFEHTCSLCTHGPSNTNESHDILKGKWQAVLSLDI